MRILAIETSCDESAISIIEAEPCHTEGVFSDVKVLSNLVLSQVDIHCEYGGVFPSLAKREHSKNLVPMLEQSLRGSGLFTKAATPQLRTKDYLLRTLLKREPELLAQFLDLIPTIEKPELDVICVTHGPGLEPCLWTGINLAKALGEVWGLPVVPVNHMEGHIFSALISRKDEFSINNFQFSKPNFPVLALLISGGHTELVLMKDWGEFEIIGRTRDDAVGEAFDKVARLLGLPYPGGPEISKLAAEARQSKVKSQTRPYRHGRASNVLESPLPRPMLESDDLDFSFSGLKTAVRYRVEKMGPTHHPTIPSSERRGGLSHTDREQLALDFENAVAEVLIAKSKKALEQTSAKEFIASGGVIANTHIRNELQKLAKEYDDVQLHLPELSLATDNALMIALAGYVKTQVEPCVLENSADICAHGNLSINGRDVA